MSLIHALVAKGTTVLAEHATSQGMFKPSTQITILSKIPPNDSKLTYVWQDKLIHYVSSDGYIYLVVADDTIGRRMPFAFLGDVERNFQNLLTNPSNPSPTTSHSLQSTFESTLTNLMDQYIGNPAAAGEGDALRQAREDMNNVKDIMVKNIDSVLARGERIENLVTKTDQLSGQAYAFRRGARGVRRQMWWKNTRIMMLSGVVCFVLLYLFVAQFCGIGLGHCRK